MPHVLENILSYQGHALPHDARKDSAKLDPMRSKSAKHNANRLESLNRIANSAAQRRSNYDSSHNPSDRRSQTQEGRFQHGPRRTYRAQDDPEAERNSQEPISPSSSRTARTTPNWDYKAVETPLRTCMFNRMEPSSSNGGGPKSASSIMAPMARSSSRFAFMTDPTLDLDREQEMNDTINIHIQDLSNEAERMFMAYECSQTISSAITGYYNGQVNVEMVKALTLYGIAAEKYSLPDLACRAQLWKAILLHYLGYTEELPVMLSDILWLIIQTGLPSDQYQYRRLWVDYSSLIWDHLRATAIAENLPHLVGSYHDFNSKVLEFLDHNLKDSGWPHPAQPSHTNFSTSIRDSILSKPSATRELQKARAQIELLRQERENLRVDNARYRAERELFSHQADGPLSTALSQDGQYPSDQHQMTSRNVDVRHDGDEVMNWLNHKHTPLEAYQQSPGRPRWGRDTSMSRHGWRLDSIASTFHGPLEVDDSHAPMNRRSRKGDSTEHGKEDTNSIQSRGSPRHLPRRGSYKEPRISSRFKRLHSWRPETQVHHQQVSSGRSTEHVKKDSDVSESTTDQDTWTENSLDTAEMADIFRGFSGDWKKFHRRPSSIISPRSNTWSFNSTTINRPRHTSGTTSIDFAHSYPSARPSPLVVRTNQSQPPQKLPSLEPEELPFTDTPSPTKLIFDNPDFESHQQQRHESVKLEFFDARASASNNTSYWARQQEIPHSFAANAHDRTGRHRMEKPVASVCNARQPRKNEANGSDDTKEHYSTDNEHKSDEPPLSPSSLPQGSATIGLNSIEQAVGANSSLRPFSTAPLTSKPLQERSSAIATEDEDFSSLSANAKAILERAADSSSASKRRSKNISDKGAPFTPSGKSPPASAVVSGSASSNVHGWLEDPVTKDSNPSEGAKEDHSPVRVAPGKPDTGNDIPQNIEATTLSATAPEFTPRKTARLDRLVTSTPDSIHKSSLPARPKVSTTMQRDRRPLAINTKQATKIPVSRKPSQPRVSSPLKSTYSLNEEDSVHDNTISSETTSEVLQAPSISEVHSRFSPSTIRRFSARYGSFGVEDSSSRDDTGRSEKDEFVVDRMVKRRRSSYGESTNSVQSSLDVRRGQLVESPQLHSGDWNQQATDQSSRRPNQQISYTAGITKVPPKRQKSKRLVEYEEEPNFDVKSNKPESGRDSEHGQNAPSPTESPNNTNTQGLEKDNTHFKTRSSPEMASSRYDPTPDSIPPSSYMNHDGSAAHHSPIAQSPNTDQTRVSIYDQIDEEWRRVSQESLSAAADLSARHERQLSISSQPGGTHDTQPVSPATQEDSSELDVHAHTAHRPIPGRVQQRVEPRKQRYRNPGSLHKESIASEYSSYQGSNPDTPAFPHRDLPLPARVSASGFLDDHDDDTPWGSVTGSVRWSQERSLNPARQSSDSLSRQGTSDSSMSPCPSYAIGDSDSDSQLQNVSPTARSDVMAFRHGQEVQRETHQPTITKVAPNLSSGSPQQGEEHVQSRLSSNDSIEARSDRGEAR